ncbi:MAG: hypothetical protein K2N56_02050, partial [Oscillospiraceae bacterium]|nr:hypothetical protein [Oscillospiraceae bacterium]
ILNFKTNEKRRMNNSISQPKAARLCSDSLYKAVYRDPQPSVDKLKGAGWWKVTPKNVKIISSGRTEQSPHEISIMR